MSSKPKSKVKDNKAKPKSRVKDNKEKPKSKSQPADKQKAKPTKDKEKEKSKKKDKAKDKSKAKPKSKAKGSKIENKPAKAPKSFPFENCPTPSKLEPTDLSRIFKLPKGKLKTEEEVINYHGYSLEEELAQGGFAMIYFARDHRTNDRVACKMMELGTEWSDSRVEDMKNELFIMERVKHVYVVRMDTSFLTNSSKNGNRLYIFMELADGGDFAKFCQKKGAMTEAESKLYLAQIVCGINHMHSLGIAHRDIKLQNILLLRNEMSISGDYTLLVADFGLSRVMKHEQGGALALNQTCCGTPLFMSPEILLKKAYNAFAVDLWALGVTIYIMLTLEIPFDFHDKQQAILDMMARKWEYPHDKMQAPASETLKKITAGLLEPDTRKRYTMSKLCSDKWLAETYKKAQRLANKQR